MSAMRHATISAWQRHEDGSYAAEINGWALRVEWHPESTGDTHSPHRGFSWTAEQGTTKLASREIFEEIEVAMAHAEERVAPDPPAHDAKTIELGDVHGHH